MAKKLSAFGILYLERDRCSYYLPDRDQPLLLMLNKEILNDLEIVSTSTLERQLHNWFEEQKITPINTIILLSDQVYFEQEFQGTGFDESNEQVKEFVELVPFHQKHVSFLPGGQNTKVVVVNEQLIFPCVEVLKQLNFPTLAVLPAYILGTDFTQIKPSDLIISLAHQLEQLLPFNMIAGTPVGEEPTEEKPFYSFKIDKKVITLLVVFGVLIAVLVGLLLSQNNQEQAQDVSAPVAASTPVPVAPTPEIVSNSEAPTNEQLQITLSTSAPTAEAVAQLVTGLEAITPQVVVEDSQAEQTQSLIMVASNVDTAMRTALYAVIRSYDEDVSVQESTELQPSTVLITLRSVTAP